MISAKAGASCRGEGVGPLAPGAEADLELAVLAYGVSAAAIDRLVSDALEDLLSPAGAAWAKRGSC